jgi:hypothetical protein
MIFGTAPSSSDFTRMFDGLRSRWMTPRLVRVLHSAADLEEQLETPRDREPRSVAMVRDPRTFDVLHDDVGTAAPRPCFVGLCDVGMAHERERLSLRLEARKDLRAVRSRLQALDGHAPANGFVLHGLEDFSHPSFAHETDGTVRAELDGLTAGKQKARPGRAVRVESLRTFPPRRGIPRALFFRRLERQSERAGHAEIRAFDFVREAAPAGPAGSRSWRLCLLPHADTTASRSSRRYASGISQLIPGGALLSP